MLRAESNYVRMVEELIKLKNYSADLKKPAQENETIEVMCHR